MSIKNNSVANLPAAWPLSGVKTSHLALVLGFVLLLTACRDKGPAASSAETTIKLDSTLGIGKNIQFFPLPGVIVAVNPDSANRVIIVGKDGKIIHTIYKNADSTALPQVLNKITVDSSSMEIYIYSSMQHHIFVYDTAGNYKTSIPIQRIHNGGFSRIKGKFVFLDKPDSTKKGDTKIYVVDSAGRDVDGL